MKKLLVKIVSLSLALLMVLTVVSGCVSSCPHTQWRDGICIECRQQCAHATYSNGICVVCGKQQAVTPCTNHNYASGICTVCGVACAHNWANGNCANCSMACSHNFANGVCTICGSIAPPCAQHTYSNGVCTVCGDICTHNFVNNTCTICGKDSTVYNTDYREDRNLTTVAHPTNLTQENTLPAAPTGSLYTIGTTLCMLSGTIRLDFIYSASKYSFKLINTDVLNSTMSPYTGNSVMGENVAPAKLYIRSVGQIEQGYDTVTATNYGYLAKARITTDGGSVIDIEDRYYFAQEEVVGSFNCRRTINVVTAGSENGFESIYDIDSANATTSNYQWFVPNNIFDNYPTGTSYKIYRETLLGLPFAALRNKTNGYTITLGRYQPTISYQDNSYAGITALSYDNNEEVRRSTIEVSYPSRDTARKYFSISNGKSIVYDLTMSGLVSSTFAQAMVDSYNNHYTLQDQRIVNTDIDEVYDVICEDFKDFMLSTNRGGVTSYGLPWRVTVETGKIGPKSYQSGFVGQQIPAAYNMLLYGVMNNDYQSLLNGVHILDFWLSAGMMNASGVPKIWYNGDYNTFNSYPTFLRMAVDTMEGYLDAYRLAEAHGINRPEWLAALTKFANWLVTCQNTDGSWYRCYNWSGTYFKDGDNGIGEPGGNICQSTSKKNSTMPIRFLAKMYEMTNNSAYRTTAIKGGGYVYNNLYPENVYYGGTCDNPNAIDKEAGVYAMYAYDALYMLTNDSKWIPCLKQATAFTMSTVIGVSFPVRLTASDLKAAKAFQYGYTDGCSYIVCGGSGIDNYIAYIYYQLFRVYIITGEQIYLDMAEFIQQNTKSSMDWDGALNYPYKSLVPEASTIYSFGFSSATDDEGVMGVWLPWSSVANAEPIAKMLVEFGCADVAQFRDYSIVQLREMLNDIGVGGNAHRQYTNTVVSQLGR